MLYWGYGAGISADLDWLFFDFVLNLGNKRHIISRIRHLGIISFYFELLRVLSNHRIISVGLIFDTTSSSIWGLGGFWRVFVHF